MLVLSAAVAFLVVATISTILAFTRYGLGFSEGAEVVAFLIRWCAYALWYPFVAWCLTDDESRRAMRYVDAALLVIAGFGVVQSAMLPEFGQLVPWGGVTWEFQGRRLVSTMLDPNFAGCLIVLAMLPRVALLAEGQRIRGTSMAMLVAALLLTASRSAVLALLAGIVVIILSRGVRVQLLRVAGVGVLLLLPFTSLLIDYIGGFGMFTIDASAAQRVVTWHRAIVLILEHPVLGIGFNATRIAQVAHGWPMIGGGDTAFDGGLLFIMVMTGAVGLFFYLRMLWRVYALSRRIWRDAARPAADRAQATATAAATVAVVVDSLFTNSLLLPFVMQVLWMRWAHLTHLRLEPATRVLFVAKPPAATLATATSPSA